MEHKNRLSLFKLLQTLCHLIGNQGQQEPLPAPQQGETLHDNAVDAVRTSITENLQELMDAHNPNLPQGWTFPEFTNSVFQEELTDLTHSVGILKDLSLYGISSDAFHQALNVLSNISGTGLLLL